MKTAKTLGTSRLLKNFSPIPVFISPIIFLCLADDWVFFPSTTLTFFFFQIPLKPFFVFFLFFSTIFYSSVHSIFYKSHFTSVVFQAIFIKSPYLHFLLYSTISFSTSAFILSFPTFCFISQKVSAYNVSKFF